MLFNYKLFAKVYYFLLLIFLITAGGTIGFMIIEGWNLVDSFYMTIITISTVGFREVHELSVYGKLFTAFLIIFSFGTFAYAVTSITTYLVGGGYKRYFLEYKTMKETKKMKNHVIICGYGRVGQQVAEDLMSHDTPFVIIETNEEIIENSIQKGYTFLKGDSTHDEILKMAGIKDAKAVITCLPKDADNIYVVLAAREYKKNILIVSRASYQSSVSKLKMAGANNVIMPDTIGGSHMASLIANPDVMEFIDNIRVQGDVGSNMESIAYNELPEEYKGKSIKELEASKITGVTIVGFKSADGEYIVNPDCEIKVSEGTKIFVLGTTDQILKIAQHFQLKHWVNEA